MSNEWADFNPNELGDEYGNTKLQSFDSNIGVLASSRAHRFDSGEIQATLNFRIEESIPSNKGKYASLRYPATAPTEKWVDNARVAMTGEELAAARKTWLAGWARILSVLELAPPTAAQTENEFTVMDWLKPAEGKRAIFPVYEDKKGYGAIPAQAVDTEQRKAHVGLSRLDAPALDRKRQPIEGVTRLMQARKAIEDYKS